MGRLLNRHLRDTWQRSAALVVEDGGVANDKDLWVAGNGKIRFDDRPSRAIQRDAERSHQWRGRDPGSPEHGAGREPVGCAEHDAMLINRRDRRPLQNFDAQALQRRARGVAELRWKRGQDRLARLNQDDARSACVDRSKLVAQRLARNFRECSGELDAGGTAANEHEGEQLLPPRWICFMLSALEREQDAAANLEGILERLEAGRMARPLVVPEIAVAGAGRDDQVVVPDGRSLVQPHFPRGQINRPGLGEQHTDVRGMTEDPADRGRDVAGRQRRRRDLVEQRLKEVIVVAVEQRDPQPCVPENFHGGKAAEPAADHDHVLGPFGPFGPFVSFDSIASFHLR